MKLESIPSWNPPPLISATSQTGMKENSRGGLGWGGRAAQKKLQTCETKLTHGLLLCSSGVQQPGVRTCSFPWSMLITLCFVSFHAFNSSIMYNILLPLLCCKAGCKVLLILWGLKLDCLDTNPSLLWPCVTLDKSLNHLSLYFLILKVWITIKSVKSGCEGYKS